MSRGDALTGPPSARPDVVGRTTPAHRLSFLLLRLIFDGYFTTHVSGRENLPPPGRAAIVTSNHTSALDVFVAGHALRRPAHYVAKVEATRMPLLGPLMLAVGAVPARRDDRDTDVLRRLLAVLEAGGLVGLAPEGTRSRDGRLQPFDPGFVWLAARTGALVVPSAIHGAYHLMPRGAGVPRPGHLWVRFGTPISYEAPGGASGGRAGMRVAREELQARADAVRERTRDLLAALSRESGLPEPALEA